MHSYPTAIHAEAADLASGFLRALPGVDTALLVNSCARGQGLPTSDLDLAVLVDHAKDSRSLESNWWDFYGSSQIFRRLESLGVFCCVHVDFFDGSFRPSALDAGGGPDSFELEIGNWIAHSHTLFSKTQRLSGLKKEWLPFYGEELRARRLEMVSQACRLDLLRTRHCVERGQHFQAFDSLYKAMREFLQGFFIQARVYPLSYSKWMREQLAEIPGGLAVLDRLTSVIQIRDIRSGETAEKADLLEALVSECLRDAGPANKRG